MAKLFNILFYKISGNKGLDKEKFYKLKKELAHIKELQILFWSLIEIMNKNDSNE